MKHALVWHFWQRPFVVSLAVLSALVGLPILALAVWWGVQAALAGDAATLRGMQCPVPWDAKMEMIRAEERDLRSRAAALGTEFARKRAACPLCPPVGSVDIALIMDTSLSMGWPATMDAASERVRQQELERAAGSNPAALGQALTSAIRSTPPGQERMEVARTAVLSAIEDLPQRARIHLFSFGFDQAARDQSASCKIRDHGSFDASGRSRLQAAVRSLRADAPGTPIAEAISRGATAVRNRPDGAPGSIIIVTDGTESCGGDPCAAALAARAADPGLSITVLDVARNEHVACLAQSTGGRVLTPAPGAGAEIARQLTKALRPSEPRACIPRPAD